MKTRKPKHALPRGRANASRVRNPFKLSSKSQKALVQHYQVSVVASLLAQMFFNIVNRSRKKKKVRRASRAKNSRR